MRFAVKIFVSAGKTWTSEQEDFVSAIEDFLRRRGHTPCTVDRNVFTSQQPMMRIRELMNEAGGIVIIAYERTRIAEGTQKKGTQF